MRRLLLSCTLAVLGSGAAVANPIRLTLAVEPEESLPGVPVTLRVSAINTGSVPARLAGHARLEVTAGGTTFYAYPGARGDADAAPLPMPDGRAASWIDLAPGEERRFDFFSAPGSPAYFCDERLQQPGIYRLRLRADISYSAGDPVPVEDPSISNEAILTMTTPTGVDAQAWTVIREMNLCMGWDSHAATLWSEYPDSIYTAMTVRPSPRRDREAEMASLQATLAKNPPAGFADALKLNIANRHIMFMERAMLREGDVQTAFEHSEAARLIFEELASKETALLIKMGAGEGLRVGVMTLAELQDYDRRLRALEPPAIPCEGTQVAVVRSEIASVVGNPATSKQARSRLEMVLKNLDQYAAHLAKTPSAMSNSLHELRSAVGEIQHTKGSVVPTEEGTRWLDALTAAAALSARKAVDAATADSGARTNMLAQAQQNLKEASTATDQRDFQAAVRLYKAALDKAEAASKLRVPFC